MVSGVARIVLASRSPRRIEILRREGVPFESIEAAVDDAATPPAGDPAVVAMSLALAKARQVAAAHPGSCAGAFVVGADTICRHGHASIGKACSPEEARSILRAMMDGEHRVVTGVALIRDGRERAFVDEALVRLEDPGAREIDAYIGGGAWRGKAGAYDIAERRRAGWTVHCRGDEDTVGGLPWKRVRAEIEAWR
jgi:septum formation protein